MILVSGGTGLLGAQVLLDLLKHGKEVRSIHRSGSDFSVTQRIFAEEKNLYKEIRWVEAEVCDVYSLEKAFEQVSEVYHCAGLVSFQPKDRKLLHAINVEGTANMVNLALSQGVNKFCHVSSVSALGRISSAKEINEESMWQPGKSVSNYSISKFQSEMEVWRGMEEGLRVVIVNPSIILGPGDWSKGSSRIFSSIWHGIPFYTNGITGYVDVRDVSACMIQLMDRNIFGERFLLNSENISFKKLFDLIAACFNKKKPGIEIRYWQSQLAWRMFQLWSMISGKNALVTKETAHNSLQKWHYSNSKIRNRLGYHFITIEESVKYNCMKFIQYNNH